MRISDRTAQIIAGLSLGVCIGSIGFLLYFIMTTGSKAVL